jgi:hypothetical protein
MAKATSTELSSLRGSPSACRVSLHVVSVAKRCKAAPISVVSFVSLNCTRTWSVHDNRTSRSLQLTDPCEVRLRSAAESQRRIHRGRIEGLYMTAGLGPEPPFTHMPRLHEHDAAAQADTGTFIELGPRNDNRSNPNRHPRTPGSGSSSDAAIL